MLGYPQVNKRVLQLRQYFGKVNWYPYLVNKGSRQTIQSEKILDGVVKR